MDNIEKVLEKQELRYVLGTAVSGKIARMMLNNYIQDTGDTESELVIIPLVISYELVKIL